MDRRSFIIQTGALAAAGAVGATTVAWREGVQPAVTSAAAVSAPMRVTQTAQAVLQGGQSAFALLRFADDALAPAQQFDEPMHLRFYGFGARAEAEADTLASLSVDALYRLPDGSTVEHLLWLHSGTSGSAPLRITTSASNFVGLQIKERSANASAQGGWIERNAIVTLSGEQGLVSGHYALLGADEAALSPADAGYSGNPRQPIQPTLGTSLNYLAFTLSPVSASEVSNDCFARAGIANVA